MNFKFYTFKLDGKNENLLCSDNNHRVYLYSQYSDNTSEWILLGNKWNERLSYMTGISELSAEEYCSHKLYLTPVRMDDKKVYPSLLDIPNPEYKKILLLAIIVGIVTIFITSIIMIALGSEIKTVFLFWLSIIGVGCCGLLFGKITGLGDSESTAIFIFIALILYKIFD